MFDNANDALAFILTLMTVANLNRFIGAVTEERTATHYRMVGQPGTPHPAISPLSDEWTELSARYNMLAEWSDVAYAELIRREQDAVADA